MFVAPEKRKHVFGCDKTSEGYFGCRYSRHLLQRSSRSRREMALSTRTSTECIAHANQALRDLDPAATVVDRRHWVDRPGVSSDLLEGLQTVAGRDAALPFVMQFSRSASTCLWEDQAEVGEQGDPLVMADFGQIWPGLRADRLWPIRLWRELVF